MKNFMDHEELLELSIIFFEEKYKSRTILYLYSFRFHLIPKLSRLSFLDHVMISTVTLPNSPNFHAIDLPLAPSTCSISSFLIFFYIVNLTVL